MIEEWKDICGYEGLYKISDFGNVKRIEHLSNHDTIHLRKLKEKILKKGVNKRGYLTVSLSQNGKKKTYKIHRLVAQTFIANPTNLPQVNHKDENKANNHVSNLEWCDNDYNTHYGSVLQRRKVGMNNNKRTRFFTYKGIKKSLAEWGHIVGIKYETLFSRIYVQHLNIEQALTMPIKNCGRHKYEKYALKPLEIEVDL